MNATTIVRCFTVLGYGTSLVYYSVYWSRSPSVAPFGELEFRMNRFLSLVAGYQGRESASATLANGWDQFDALSVNRTQRLASVAMSPSPYGAVKVNMFGPFVGLFAKAMPVNWTSFSSSSAVTSGFSAKTGLQILVGMDVVWTHTRKH